MRMGSNQAPLSKEAQKDQDRFMKFYRGELSMKQTPKGSFLVRNEGTLPSSSSDDNTPLSVIKARMASKKR